MPKSKLDELLEIYTQFKNHPLGRDLLEFASKYDQIENAFVYQRDAIEEHIIKAQLYNDTTAYKTLWNIYKNLHRKLNREVFYKIATEENIKLWLSEDFSEQYYSDIVDNVKDVTLDNYPSMEHKLSKDNYLSFLDYLIDSIITRGDTMSLDTFREDARKILGWE